MEIEQKKPLTGPLHGKPPVHLALSGYLGNRFWTLLLGPGGPCGTVNRSLGVNRSVNRLRLVASWGFWPTGPTPKHRPGSTGSSPGRQAIGGLAGVSSAPQRVPGQPVRAERGLVNRPLTYICSPPGRLYRTGAFWPAVAQRHLRVNRLLPTLPLVNRSLPSGLLSVNRLATPTSIVNRSSPRQACQPAPYR